jgi:hypothetical protein
MNPISSRSNHDRRHGERNRLVVFWTIIAICTVVSTGSLIVAYNGKSNAERSERAHCVLVKFLVGSNLRNAASLHSDPNGPGSDQRRAAVQQTAKLIVELRAAGLHCPPVPGETQAKKGTK